tara:strand:+ start:272 stop:535 length:264 start_codon:yes stop_codon:yes gene_type:complete
MYVTITRKDNKNIQHFFQCTSIEIYKSDIKMFNANNEFYGHSEQAKIWDANNIYHDGDIIIWTKKWNIFVDSEYYNGIVGKKIFPKQ